MISRQLKILGFALVMMGGSTMVSAGCLDPYDHFGNDDLTGNACMVAAALAKGSVDEANWTHVAGVPPHNGPYAPWNKKVLMQLADWPWPGGEPPPFPGPVLVHEGSYPKAVVFLWPLPDHGPDGLIARKGPDEIWVARFGYPRPGNPGMPPK